MRPLMTFLHVGEFSGPSRDSRYTTIEEHVRQNFC